MHFTVSLLYIFSFIRAISRAEPDLGSAQLKGIWAWPGLYCTLIVESMCFVDNTYLKLYVQSSSTLMSSLTPSALSLLLMCAAYS